MKAILHLVTLAVGIGIGMWWGWNHPLAAAKFDAKIQEAESKAKIDVLNKVLANSNTPGPGDEQYKQMLQDEQKKLSDAEQQIGQQQ